MLKPFLSILCILTLNVAFSAEGILLDKIDAIVNDKIILRSDIENQLDLLNLRGKDEDVNRCEFCSA
jgi:hypothetical protein